MKWIVAVFRSAPSLAKIDEEESDFKNNQQTESFLKCLRYEKDKKNDPSRTISPARVIFVKSL
jgi:hypothetical protein